MKLILGLFFIQLIILAGCDVTWDSSIKIQNKSKRNIIYETSQDSVLKAINKVEFYLERSIKPDSIERAVVFNWTWDEYIDSSFNKKLNIYFFDVDTLKKYMDMNYIITNKLFIQKKEFSMIEIKKNNRIITFK
jgi:hypothetical protein